MSITHPIVIFGGGHMGGALARHWAEEKIGAVHVVERDPVKRQAFSASGIRNYDALEKAPLDTSILILAIKPQQFATLTDAMKEQIGKCRLLVSIMAGVPLAQLEKLAPHGVRVMPNLPAMIGQSMSVACAPALDTKRRSAVDLLFSAVGEIAWVEDEAQLHAVTAISGSGPGYVFAFMEALEKAAIAQGLDPALARQLVAQTMRGSASLAAQSEEAFGALRHQVTSPGGTTEAALASFTEGGLDGLVEAAVGAALARSKALAE